MKKKGPKRLIKSKENRRLPRRRLGKDLRYNGEMLAMCAPAVIKTIIFNYLPIIGLLIAFKNYAPAKGIFGSEWAGLQNFEFFFKSNSAWTILRNTLGLNAIGIVLSTLVNLILALLLYEVTKKALLKIYQSLLFIPFFFSWVLVGLLLTVFLSPTSGMLTRFIMDITGKEVLFYSDPVYWIFILPLVQVWKGAGFGSLIYYSVLMNIDKGLFEAAEIDGATKLQRIRYICLPFLIPMICVLTIMAIGGIIRADFGLFFFVPRNQMQLLPVTDVIDTYVYRALSERADFGMSTAVGLFQSVVGFVLVVLSNRVVKFINRDYALY